MSNARNRIRFHIRSSRSLLLAGTLALVAAAWAAPRPMLPASVAQTPEPARNRIVVTGEGRV